MLTGLSRLVAPVEECPLHRLPFPFDHVASGRCGSWASGLGCLLLWSILTVGAAQAQTDRYNGGAALARACTEGNDDAGDITAALRAEGWRDLNEGVGLPEDNKIGDTLTPEALNLLYHVTTYFMLQAGDAERDLAMTRFLMEQNDLSVLSRHTFNTARKDVLFHEDVGLFAINADGRTRQAGDRAVTQIDCSFIGAAQPEDDRVRWLLPGERHTGLFSSFKRIHGADDEPGPYAGAFISMAPDGLNAVFGRDFPKLTLFSISALKAVSRTTDQ